MDREHRRMFRPAPPTVWRARLRTSPDIADVATSDAVPFSDDHNHMAAHAPGATSSEDFALVPASPDFMQLYGIRLLAGRLLSEQRGADGVLPDQLHGQEWPAVQCPDQCHRGAAHGLFAARRGRQDADSGCARAAPMSPSWAWSPTSSRMAPRIPSTARCTCIGGRSPWAIFRSASATGASQEALAFIDRTWHAFAPSVAIQRHFLDDDYDRQFLADERQGTMFGMFVGIAIFIACLGLFGLAAFIDRAPHQGDRHPQGVRRPAPATSSGCCCGSSRFPC